MEFFNSAIDVLQTLVIALGAGLGIWGVINLLEGYGNDNPGANCSYTVKKQQHKLRTAYPTILYYSISAALIFRAAVSFCLYDDP